MNATRAALFLAASLAYAATVVAVVNHVARRINAAAGTEDE